MRLVFLFLCEADEPRSMIDSSECTSSCSDDEKIADEREMVLVRCATRC